VRAYVQAWHALTHTWDAGARFGQGDTTVKLRRDNTYIISITCAPAVKLRYRGTLHAHIRPKQRVHMFGCITYTVSAAGAVSQGPPPCLSHHQR
jgi:hypothetical protein